MDIPTLLMTLLLALPLPTAGCAKPAAKDTLRDNAVAEQALADSAHPALTALARQAVAAGRTIDPAAPAMDAGGAALKSLGASVTAGVMRLQSSADELAWAIYGVGGMDATPRPDTLRLNFSKCNGKVWLGLADYRSMSWRWQELPSGLQTEAAIPADLGPQDGTTLLLTLAVHGGASADFTGGELAASADPHPAPDPANPDIVGVYLSQGYWDSDAVDETMQRLGGLGVNLVIDYALCPPENEGWTLPFYHYLNAARENGIGVVFPLTTQLYGMTPLDAGDHIQRAVDLVAQLKDQPAIRAWYIHDEVLPWIAGDSGTVNYSMSLEQMQELYDAIAAEDPSRPQISVWNFLPSCETFNRVFGEQHTPYGRPAWMSDPVLFEDQLRSMLQTTCDWVMVDSYPVGAPWLAQSTSTPEQEVFAPTHRAAALKSPQQPLLFVFQAFSWAQYEPENCAGAAFPTVEQMNSMLGAAHSAGATGAIGYSWFDLIRDPQSTSVPGQSAALDNLCSVLGALAAEGWPVLKTPLGAPQAMPLAVGVVTPTR